MADIQRKFEDTPLRPMEYREAIKWSDQANEKLRAKGLQQYVRKTTVLADGKEAKQRMDDQVQRMDDHRDYKATVADLAETIEELEKDDPDNELVTKNEEKKLIIEELRKMKWRGYLQEDVSEDSLERSYKLARTEYNNIQEKAATLTMDLNKTISVSLRTKIQSQPGYEGVDTSLQELTFLINTTETMTKGPFTVVKRDLLDTADAIPIPTTYVELQDTILAIDELHAELRKVTKRYNKKVTDIFTEFAEVIKLRINDPQLLMAKVKYEAMTAEQQEDWLYVSEVLTLLINNEKIIGRSLEKSVVVMANKVDIKTNSKDQREECMKWKQGRCMAGNTCRFKHVGQPGMGSQKPVCWKWTKGICTKGDKCEFKHERQGGTQQGKRTGVCFNWNSKSCRFGNKCRFEHPGKPNTDYAEEQCPYEKAGRECLDRTKCEFGRHQPKRRKTEGQDEE